MERIKSLAFVVRKILYSLFPWRELKCQTTAEAAWSKSVQGNIIFDVLLENVITFVRMWLSFII